PNYLMPKQVQTRLQKLMDEYVAGCATMYMTSQTSAIGMTKTTMICHPLLSDWAACARAKSGFKIMSNSRGEVAT
ncbi:MAG: hypothetical protein RDV41_07745, partial [Planctomycetota bacterium]|nr:hypothetical protein [Planctomycetota bacterium]